MELERPKPKQTRGLYPHKQGTYGVLLVGMVRKHCHSEFKTLLVILRLNTLLLCSLLCLSEEKMKHVELLGYSSGVFSSIS